MPAADDLDNYERTLYGEVRGEHWDTKIACAWVIRNRADHPGWWGHTVTEVCRKPLQFSCWNPDDPNYPIILTGSINNMAYRQCRAAACLVYDHGVPDPTNGATHYHDVSIAPPSWTMGMMQTHQSGRLIFYRLAS